MLKYAILIAVVVIGYIAYTGVDVTEEYDSASKVRNIILDDVFDPFAKKVLKQASESELDKFVESTIEKYGGYNNEM